MRQGNDVGSQYRSVIFVTDPSQQSVIEASREMFQERLSAAGYGAITSEVLPLDLETGFFYAEPYHQQYLAKNPNGYCGVGGTGVSCPIGLAT
jgi:peptide-methionine (S)-S-oxide reductase